MGPILFSEGVIIIVGNIFDRRETVFLARHAAPCSTTDRSSQGVRVYGERIGCCACCLPGWVGSWTDVSWLPGLDAVRRILLLETVLMSTVTGQRTFCLAVTAPCALFQSESLHQGVEFQDFFRYQSLLLDIFWFLLRRKFEVQAVNAESRQWWGCLCWQSTRHTRGTAERFGKLFCARYVMQRNVVSAASTLCA